MFKTVENIVKEILTRDVRSRSDDRLLVCQVYEELGVNTQYTSFREVMVELTGLPSVETITRARRKLQERGDFGADRITTDERRKKRYEAEKYAFDKT